MTSENRVEECYDLMPVLMRDIKVAYLATIDDWGIETQRLQEEVACVALSCV